jgi:transcriptional regulator with XRE-family HTH domain
VGHVASRRLIRTRKLKLDSRAAGLGVHTVTNIENRAANVRLDTVNRLAIALNVDPCLLLFLARWKRLETTPNAPLATQ